MAFAPTVVIWLQVPPLPVLRSILKPVSLVDLSVQSSLTEVVEMVLAIRPVGPAKAASSIAGLISIIRNCRWRYRPAHVVIQGIRSQAGVVIIGGIRAYGGNLLQVPPRRSCVRS